MKDGACHCGDIDGLENTVLTEIRQAQKDKYQIILLTYGLLEVATQEAENRIIAVRGQKRKGSRSVGH